MRELLNVSDFLWAVGWLDEGWFQRVSLGFQPLAR